MSDDEMPPVSDDEWTTYMAKQGFETMQAVREAGGTQEEAMAAGNERIGQLSYERMLNMTAGYLAEQRAVARAKELLEQEQGEEG